MKKNLILFTILFCSINSVVISGEADVVDVKVHKTGDSFRFDVTVLHEDAGWDHYADKWDVVSGDGTILGTRVLYHPHVNEQPFTRSLSGVKVPVGVKSLTIRAHDKIHGYGGKALTVEVE